ncbi:hypothetical protein [Nocardia sp. BMG51109]|uniref:hypothetical protein n=1 Tax=Nocardia sp. BMG51109 TaxID=1056816 RepID=UPI00046665DB|nr:hypothetical protein [Nocardia sp. BMG51109]
MPTERAGRPRAAHPVLDYPPSWLFLDLPTAVLLAVFVGTGWLGYAWPNDAETDPPMSVVVVPAENAAPPPATVPR